MGANRRVFDNLKYISSTPRMGNLRDIVQGIVDLPLFSDPIVQRLLASSATADTPVLPIIVCNMFNKLWDLTNYFDPHLSFENVLAITDVRGHFLHQFHVFLLGMNIIKACHDKFNSSDTIDPYSLWLAVSTTHDLAYPIESSDKIVKALGGIYDKIQIPHKLKYSILNKGKIASPSSDLFKISFPDKTLCLHEVCKDAYATLLKLPKHELNTCLSQRRKSLDHGYFGALFLARISNYSGFISGASYIKSQQYLGLKEKMAAIAVHTLNKPIIENVDFSSNLYGYLLYMLDQLQDWDRKLAEVESHVEFLLSSAMLEKKTIYISYIVRKAHWTPLLRERVLGLLESKAQLIQSVAKNLLGFTIHAKYRSNDGWLNYDIIGLKI